MVKLYIFESVEDAKKFERPEETIAVDNGTINVEMPTRFYKSTWAGVARSPLLPRSGNHRGARRRRSAARGNTNAANAGSQATRRSGVPKRTRKRNPSAPRNNCARQSKVCGRTG
jgi:hypothetical protein